jgi:hypothetical protein
MSIPRAAAWRRRGAYEGFEVVFIRTEDGNRLDGDVVAVESEVAWALLRYILVLAASWTTRSARVRGPFETGGRQIVDVCGSQGAPRVST